MHDVEVDPPALAMQVLFNRIARGQHLALIEHLSGDRMTPTQGLTLSLIGDGRHIARDVADGLGYDAGATTRILDNLEAKGWISRRNSEVDRRKRHLSLTVAGCSKADEFRSMRTRLWASWLSDWEVGEVETLRELLQRLLAIMTETKNGTT